VLSALSRLGLDRGMKQRGFASDQGSGGRPISPDDRPVSDRALIEDAGSALIERLPTSSTAGKPHRLETGAEPISGSRVSRFRVYSALLIALLVSLSPVGSCSWAVENIAAGHPDAVTSPPYGRKNQRYAELQFAPFLRSPAIHYLELQDRGIGVI